VLLGKGVADFLIEMEKFIGEGQAGAEKIHRRFDLRTKREVFPRQAKLPEQFA
jgi:hypothetical protein